MYDRDELVAEIPAPPAAAAGVKEIRVGVLSSITKLDPREAVDNISSLVLGQIFESPYAVASGDTAVRPLLFEPLRQEGPTRYSAAVRPGIRFSDGTPLTPELAVRSLRGAKALQAKARVEARDGRVAFTLNEPNPRFDLTLTQQNIAIVLDKGSQLLGTGAFVFEQRPNLRLLQSAKSIRLARNREHHGRAAADFVEFLVLPAGERGTPTLLVEALRAQRVDVTNALTLADLKTYGLTGLTPSLQPGNSTGVLFFNCERHTLRDPRVRRGMALALDLHHIAACSYDKNPAAFIAPNLLPPLMGRVSGIPATDRTAAKELLDASAAKPSRLGLLVPWAPRPYMPKPLPAAQAIQSQLAQMGITVDLLETRTSEEFFDNLVRGNYDLALAGWIADTPDPADYFEALLWSKMCEGDNHSNHSRYRDAAMDAALARFRANPSEENKKEIHRLVAEEAPLVPLIYGQSVVVHSRKLRNVTVSATGVMSLADVTVG
jgi:ABC-type transport system substrate-binding protein